MGRSFPHVNTSRLDYATYTWFFTRRKQAIHISPRSVCFKSTFFFFNFTGNQKCTNALNINDMCSGRRHTTHLDLFDVLCSMCAHLVRGTSRVVGAQVDPLSFHAKAVQMMGKPKVVCGRHKFLSHMFATDVKMGTDDHVPFYPALLNSL